MARNKIKEPALERFRKREPMIGTSFDLASQNVVEASKLAPLDFCILDWEHGLWDETTLPGTIATLYDSPMLCFVRVPHLMGPYIKKVLDWGADGVIVPNAHGVEDAKLAIEEAKYVPIGHRGIGPYRPSKNYTEIYEYAKCGNEDTLLMFMLEQIDLVNSLDEVCALEGVDGFIVGPNDLSCSLGKFYPDQRDEVNALAEKAMLRCVENEKCAGIFFGDYDQIVRWKDQGINLMIIGDDAEFIREGMKNVASYLKR